MKDDITIEKLEEVVKPSPTQPVSNLEQYLDQNGFVITEKEFFKVDLFYTDAIEDNLVYTVTNLLKDKLLIILDVPYLAKKVACFTIFKDIIARHFPEAIAEFTARDTFLLISKNKEVHDFLLLFPADALNTSISILILTRSTLNRLELEDEDECLGLIFPTIQNVKLDVANTTAHSINFNVCVDEDIKQIIMNKNNLKCYDGYKNSNVMYLVLMYDQILDAFKVIHEAYSNNITVKNLQPNTGYFIKIAIKFGKIYSESSKTFILYTKRLEEEKSSLYVCGNNTANCLLVNQDNFDREDFKTRWNFNDTQLNEAIPGVFDERFVTRAVRLNVSNVACVQITGENSHILLNNGKVMTMVEECISSNENDECYMDVNYVDVTQKNELYHINLPKYVRKISCGDLFSLFLTLDNELYSSGFNNHGELGLNMPDNIYVKTPQRVRITQDGVTVPVIDIATGRNHAIAKIFYNERSFIYTWGKDQKVQLFIKDPGSNTNNIYPDSYRRLNNSMPSVLNFMEAKYVTKIIAGFNHSAYICHNPDTRSNNVYTTGAVTEPLCLGYNSNKAEDLNIVPILVDCFKESFNVLDVAFGEKHTLFLVKNHLTGKNEVYACGANANYIYGPDEKIVGSEIPQKIAYEFEGEPVKISTGLSNTLIVTDNGDVMMIGKLNDENNEIITKFTEVDLRDKCIKEVGNYDNNLYILAMDK
jgi:alpha-tubulin suppressor-like RCC1 family protein